MLIHKRPTLQVQPNNKDESKYQKYNNKDRYLLTSVGVKWLLAPSLATKKGGHYNLCSNRVCTQT
jgi:hypothetical protein